MTILRFCPKCGDTVDPAHEGRRGPCRGASGVPHGNAAPQANPECSFAPQRTGSARAQPHSGATGTTAPVAAQAANGSRSTTSNSSRLAAHPSTFAPSSPSALAATTSSRDAPGFLRGRGHTPAPAIVPG